MRKVRLPASVVEALERKAGVGIEMRAATEGGGTVARSRRVARAVARLDRLAKPVPREFQFDRIDANERGEG